jgi:hypothetical protein
VIDTVEEGGFMGKAPLFDEFHLSFYAPPQLSEKALARLRRTLSNREFVADLRDAVQVVIRRYSALRQIRATVSR